MNIAFVINARNKEKFVGKAVQSALSQSVPCEIILSDQGSSDKTYEVMESEVNNYLNKGVPIRFKTGDIPHKSFI